MVHILLPVCCIGFRARGCVATPPPGSISGIVWVKMRSLGGKDSSVPGVVKRRAEPQRQRRLLLRLATSVGTLLRLRLRYSHDPNTRHSFPIPPALALHILKLLSEGTEVSELVELVETTVGPAGQTRSNKQKK